MDQMPSMQTDILRTRIGHPRKTIHTDITNIPSISTQHHKLLVYLKILDAMQEPTPCSIHVVDSWNLFVVVY